MEQKGILCHKGCLRALFSVFFICSCVLYWMLFHVSIHKDIRIAHGNGRSVLVTKTDRKYIAYENNRSELVTNTDRKHIVSGDDRSALIKNRDRKHIAHGNDRDALVTNTDRNDILSGDDRSALITNTDRKHIVSGNDQSVRGKINTDRKDILSGDDRSALVENIDKKHINFKQMMFWSNESIFDDITCRSDRQITSCVYSKVKILNVNRYARTVDVGIYLYDGYRNAKTKGGDVILLWAERRPSGGQAPGHVTDQMNGTYSGRVSIHWSGQTRIFVKLASAKENLCLRFKAMKKYGNSVYALKTPYGIHYRFFRFSAIEYTRCSPHNFVYGYKSLCNFTSLNGGLSWFCGKPSKKGLDCSSFNRFQMKPYNKRVIAPKQPKVEEINEAGHCVFKDSLKVEIEHSHDVLSNNRSMNVPKCLEMPKKESWIGLRPTGYILKQNWIFNDCLSTLKYDANSLNNCLKGRRITFIGDSTLRQYLETLAEVMKLKIHSSGISSDFSKSADSAKLNIHVSWRKHEMPFHNMQLFKQQDVQSSAFQINKLANDDSVSGNVSIVVVHYGSHLQAFPPDVYRSRLQFLAKALKRLLAKKPATRIFVKGAAPIIDDNKWFDVRIALIYNEILYEEFLDLQDQVIYLDVFSIFVANNMQNLHPTGQAMHNQIQQLMAYLC